MNRQAQPRSGGEALFAQWWAQGGAHGHDWRTVDGRSVRIEYCGRPGGSAGPDFRDAVVTVAGVRLVGDVELHLRAAQWHAHGHDRDPRYDAVVLHVVAAEEKGTSTAPTLLASGATVPLLPCDGWRHSAAPPSQWWPCQHGAAPATDQLAQWGSWRFAARVTRFQQELGATTVDHVLLGAVAEALGYGRAHLATRAAALAPSVLSRPALDRLSSRRIAGLQRMTAQGGGLSFAARCCGALLAGGWERLVALFAPAIGRPRAAIVVWNAVLPCLAALGDRCGNVALGRAARGAAYGAPGLPPNTITRHMVHWVGLQRHPSGALAQQGLQHLHATWCRAKTCQSCPLSH